MDTVNSRLDPTISVSVVGNGLDRSEIRLLLMAIVYFLIMG